MAVMENNNVTVTQFVLLGLSQNPRAQMFLFFFFLAVYSTTWVGNLTIIVTVITTPKLHTPMYFLLINLAVIDISESTVTSLKVLWDSFSNSHTISYNWCLAQIFFLHLTGGAVVFLLVVMAVDRYIAIYKPLQYLLIMNRGVCTTLVAGAWVGGFVHSLIQIGILVQLPFCSSNILDHFYCDIPQLIKLACTDTHIIEMLMVCNSGFLLTLIFFMLLVSYTIILVKIRTHVTEGQHKALCTCAAHILVTSLNFVPAMFVYDRPFKVFPGDKIAAVLYSVLTPMLNSMIFTFRNTEMRNTIRKLMRKHLCSNKITIIISQKNMQKAPSFHTVTGFSCSSSYEQD